MNAKVIGTIVACGLLAVVILRMIRGNDEPPVPGAPPVLQTAAPNRQAPARLKDLAARRPQADAGEWPAGVQVERHVPAARPVPQRTPAMADVPKRDTERAPAVNEGEFESLKSAALTHADPEARANALW